ncbi:MAG: type II toxin-antitoxin system VapC family toxin [Myxococcota bacterium]
MIGLDTNVLVRYLVDDDEEQANAAAILLSSGEQFYVSHIVLCESVWVLRSSYRRQRHEVADALQALLRSPQLSIQAPHVAERALARYASGTADFADYLIAEDATAAGCATVATFDKKLLAESGFVRP